MSWQDKLKSKIQPKKSNEEKNMNWEDKLKDKIAKDKKNREELEKKIQEEKKKLEKEQKQKEKINFFNEVLVPAFNELADNFSKGYKTEIKQQSDLNELGLTIKVLCDHGNFNFKVFVKGDKLFYEESATNTKSESSKRNTLLTIEFETPDGNYTHIKKEQVQEACVDSFIKIFE